MPRGEGCGDFFCLGGSFAFLFNELDFLLQKKKRLNIREEDLRHSEMLKEYF